MLQIFRYSLHVVNLSCVAFLMPCLLKKREEYHCNPNGLGLGEFVQGSD
jgi:hypothetical protein